ncbi:aminotransferase class III-fold pyridoxal phosphate-dependent enzyme [Dactylosporangium sp. CA-139114]|uniref:aminotransferase class III-fold pyridoxal phosphate-dependent enzyme n=1 Tax=Dactylosporangium sp. CA-139114 TaxID=3239931 RepID=UPI003D9965D0
MTGAEHHWWERTGAAARRPGYELAVAYARSVAEEHVNPLLALGLPLSVAGAEGSFVFDQSGTALLDLRTGGGAFALGHRNAAVVRALVTAAGAVDMGDWQLPSELRTRLSKALSDSQPRGTWQWRFCVSGSEGNELALRTAVMATERTGLAAIEGGYHGQTGLAAAVTDPRYLHAKYPPLLAEPIRLAPDASAAGAIDESVAAVIVEPVQLTEAIRPLEPDFLAAIRRRCDEVGAVLIFDEVKCGLGRTGPVWAHERGHVAPDMLVTGKALSGGLYPVAACGIRTDGSNQALLKWRSDFRSTYGGSLLGMVVATEAVAQLTNEDNRRAFRDAGDELEAALNPSLGRRLHRMGMAFSIDFESPDHALFVASDLLHRGVLVPFPRASTLLLFPPFTLGTEEARTAARAIVAAADLADDLLWGIPNDDLR